MKTTPKPRATKNRSGELDPPPPFPFPLPVCVGDGAAGVADAVDIVIAV